MLGTSGNLSILIEEKPLQFLITESGKDKGELTENDFLLVDENAHNVILSVSEESHNARRSFVANAPQDDIAKKPSAETLLHSAIYKHASAKAVFHVHTTNSTLLSMKSKSNIVFSDLEMLKGLGFKTHEIEVIIPVIDNNQDMKYLAGLIPNYLNKDIPGLILRGHGLYAWGQSVHEAKRHIEIFEFLFEYRVKELSLGK